MADYNLPQVYNANTPPPVNRIDIDRYIDILTESNGESLRSKKTVLSFVQVRSVFSVFLTVK